MRDKLVHDYFRVDLDTVWLAATEDLPHLLNYVGNLLGHSTADNLGASEQRGDDAP